MATKKLMTSRTYSGTFPSIETPPGSENNDGPGIGYPKGWSSERVPRSNNRTRKNMGPTTLMPFSSGRTLPSKWEDAERWICSPVSLGNISSNSSYCYYTVGPGGSKPGSNLAHYQRRIKSKSGPLGQSGPVFYGGGYNSFSPVLGVGVINGGRWRNSLAIESPGLASARFEERLGLERGRVSEEGRKSCPGDATWLDSWSGPGSPTQDELNLNEDMNQGNLEQQEQHNYNNVDPQVDRAISRRDMATQMFPESESSSPSSAISSPKSLISTTSPRPIAFNEPERDVQSPEYEVRDVQVDKQISATRSNQGANYSKVRESDQPVSSSTSIIEAGSKISKSQREEARINAWENLQKAKAEAAIQKLEEKLEKKRTSSMNKIIQKLRSAEIKAQKMRSSVSSGDDHESESRAISKTTSKIPLFCKKIRVRPSVKSCYTCYPF